MSRPPELSRHDMPMHPPDPSLVARRTLAHYDEHAADYEAATRDHDVRANIAALLRHVDAKPAAILDFGCGPGRDLAAFAVAGHAVVGLDGSIAFVERARAATGAEVWHQDFFALALPRARFDGVFANATLQHVPGKILPDVLARLHAALKPRGVLFASIPHGADEEGWNGERYSARHSVERWGAHLATAGFVEEEHFYRPAGLARAEQHWFASVWRKAADGQDPPSP